ncbi:MAG: outer membrane beta-barrel protein [Terracidiphilus sp.]|jgi:opacity protein-like surface antigen
MGLKTYLGPTLAALLVCATVSVFAQTVPAATRNKVPLAVGAGVSGYNADLGAGDLFGGTLWIDYTLPHMPHLLNGLGLEVEGRDLNYGRSPSAWTNLRMDVASGGVIYSWPRYRNFRPYGKYLMGFGNIDYGAPVYPTQATRTVTSMGGGVDYRVFRNIWARADYEFQSWPDFWKLNGAAHGASLTPEGFTVGAMYHFGQPSFR